MLLKGGKVFYKGNFSDADIEIDDESGKILNIGTITKKETSVNLSGKIIIPGAIDAHVHFRDLDEAYKEDFLSGGKAAIHGGITRVFEMPNSKPEANNLRVLMKKISLDPKIINMHFFGGVKDEINAKEIEDIIIGYKFYMYNQDYMSFSKILKNLNKKIAFHAEIRKEDSIRNEIEAIKMISGLKKAHVCHVSTGEGLRIAKESNLTVEVSPHHLLLDKRDDLKFNVRPPLREKRERMQLWRNFDKIDIIASDHAPHTDEEKEDGACGFSGIETMLPLMLDLVRRRILTMESLIEKISLNPARIFGLNNEIEIGRKANLTIIDMKKEYKISGDDFYSKSKFTPFEGMHVKGKPTHVIVNGKMMMKDEILIF